MSRNYGLTMATLFVLLSFTRTLSAQSYALTELGSAVNPVAVNDAGQIAGWNNQGEFLYSGGTWQNLGTLGGPDNSHTSAEAINDEGQVVGASLTSTGAIHPFLYAGGTMRDLGTLPAPYDAANCATGINSSGEVVGYSFISGGKHHPCLPLQRQYDAGPRHVSRRRQQRG